jgi:ParB-like chromosome segregation protein Spo0J
MKVELIDITRVIPYARNPRKNEAAVAKVAASIKEFGWRQPIVVDGEMVILAGHTRYLAAQRLGMEKVPVHVAKGLSPQQARAYRIMDNRSRDASEWDLVLLPLELSELKAAGVDSETAGFSDEELGAMLAPAAQEIPEGNREIDEDAFAETKSECPQCGFKW